MAVIANTGSIADFAYNRVDGVPAAISGTVMQQFAEQNVYQLENHTGQSISTSSIDQKYVPFLTDMTVAMTLSRMHGIGVDFNWTLGDFKVSKGQSQSNEALQVDVALKNASMALRNLPKKHRFYQTFYG